MKFDSFLSSPRWEILQILAKTPSSPIELAETLGTTVAYMSQQLKLLDAAGLVVKKKTGASERGKPRSIYGISRDMSYFVSLNSEMAEKRLISAKDVHKTIFKIWMIEDESLHYYFEKLYWKLEENLKEIDAIYLDFINPKFFIISDSAKAKSLIQSCVSKFDKKVDCEFGSRAILKKSEPKNIVVIHGPSLKDIELKGGSENI